ncbi:MAG: hypothetical protein HC849_24210 [Oscillatoriales cyanobacterium RU_3_3]|nr:hypothetical protein [Microcoleus sp. SU_5_6]NJL68045.1 hypothetical protein [Microcoleus sp. SM1_3_4]NJM62600.1 hypothetical protein [Oscillatoriales cyanobacterium RU_3_3]NJR24231.1 hypothetical protein [Richelia sp. CSU_2_1]
MRVAKEPSAFDRLTTEPRSADRAIELHRPTLENLPKIGDRTKISNRLTPHALSQTTRFTKLNQNTQRDLKSAVNPKSKIQNLKSPDRA